MRFIIFVETRKGKNPFPCIREDLLPKKKKNKERRRTFQEWRDLNLQFATPERGNILWKRAGNILQVLIPTLVSCLTVFHSREKFKYPWKFYCKYLQSKHEPTNKYKYYEKKKKRKNLSNLSPEKEKNHDKYFYTKNLH